MEPAIEELRCWRNAPFPPQVYRLPASLIGKTFAMDVRAVGGQGPALISLDTAVSASANGIWAVEAAAGRFRIQIDQPTLQAAWDAALVGGLMKSGEAAPLIYRLLITTNGVPQPWLEGPFIIEPGVTLS
jgi:hypothetical protein